MSTKSTTGLDRRAAVATLLADRRDLAVVTGLGSPSYDVMAAGDHELNYYLWAAMGSAAMVGFGLAMAQPQRPVLVVTGDGEQLMGLGGLATIAVRQPPNLTVAVLDNGHFGETGLQRSHTGYGLDLSAVAASCGFGWIETVETADALPALRERILARSGLGFATIRVAADTPTRALPPRDAVYIKTRFRQALGFSPS